MARPPSNQIGEAFHHAAIDELCRVAREVRIFPFVALGGIGSAYVSPVVDAFRQRGCMIRVERVPYEFQRGGNIMMRIRRHAEA